ncbi:MAG: NAD(P)H-dependent oxidoreductase [Gammaproteobacteria bacterium]|nr:NAD(P)H-dependent oxidoreductase [Gammaproteobacteria bacterium]
MKKDEIIQAYAFRHACKVFDVDKKIAEDDFSLILETGRLSPSSFGFEPWRFLVVQNRALREKLKQVTWGAQGTLPTASHFVVILARKQKSMHYDSQYITHMMQDVHHLPTETIEKRRGYYQQFMESDFSLLSSERATFDWATKQIYIAMGNMMTSAAMIGVDSCPVEGFNAKELEQVMVDDFGIDIAEFGVACMVSFGYRVNEPGEKTRQNIDEITQWYN